MNSQSIHQSAPDLRPTDAAPGYSREELLALSRVVNRACDRFWARRNISPAKWTEWTYTGPNRRES